jgi:phage-related protein
MRSLAVGVKEIRVHVMDEWRIVYVAKLAEAIYVLHAFRKKSHRTDRNDIELARKRFKEIGGK